jgi:hypothetical protein
MINTEDKRPARWVRNLEVIEVTAVTLSSQALRKTESYCFDADLDLHRQPIHRDMAAMNGAPHLCAAKDKILALIAIPMMEQQ